MASVSKHPSDILNWIGKVIDSCETIEQVMASNRLLFLFERFHKQEIHNNLVIRYQERIYNKLSSLSK